MGIESWFLFLLIGLAAGWLANRLTKGGRHGLIGNLIIGVAGSIFGGWIFNLLGISTTGILGSLVTALVGAIVLLYILRWVRKG